MAFLLSVPTADLADDAYPTHAPGGGVGWALHLSESNVPHSDCHRSGASLDALLRFGLAEAFNQLWPTLKGQHVSHHPAEASTVDHPQCLEQVNHRSTLEAFLMEDVAELHKVRVLMLSCETPTLASA